MHFELYRDQLGHFRWRLRAANGRTIADSAEGYWNKTDCYSAINLIKQNASSALVQDLAA